MYTVCSYGELLACALACGARAPRGGFGWARGSIEGPFVLISYLFFRKKSTFLKALLIGRGGPVRLIGSIKLYSVCSSVNCRFC